MSSPPPPNQFTFYLPNIRPEEPPSSNKFLREMIQAFADLKYQELRGGIKLGGIAKEEPEQILQAIEVSTPQLSRDDLRASLNLVKKRYESKKAASQKEIAGLVEKLRDAAGVLKDLKEEMMLCSEVLKALEKKYVFEEEEDFESVEGIIENLEEVVERLKEMATDDAKMSS